MAELPSPKRFAAASRRVREDDIARHVPCGPDVAAHVDAVTAFADARFTHVALVQIGGDAQDAFFDCAGAELLPELRSIG